MWKLIHLSHPVFLTVTLKHHELNLPVGIAEARECPTKGLGNEAASLLSPSLLFQARSFQALKQRHGGCPGRPRAGGLPWTHHHGGQGPAVRILLPATFGAQHPDPVRGAEDCADAGPLQLQGGLQDTGGHCHPAPTRPLAGAFTGHSGDREDVSVSKGRLMVPEIAAHGDEEDGRLV